MIKQVTGLLDEDVDKLGVQVAKIEGRIGIPGGGERAGHDGRDSRFFGICVHVDGGNLLDRGACGFQALCFDAFGFRSEEHTSELKSLMRTSYAVLCLKKKKTYCTKTNTT